MIGLCAQSLNLSQLVITQPHLFKIVIMFSKLSLFIDLPRCSKICSMLIKLVKNWNTNLSLASF